MCISVRLVLAPSKASIPDENDAAPLPVAPPIVTPPLQSRKKHFGSLPLKLGIDSLASPSKQQRIRLERVLHADGSSPYLLGWGRA